LPRNFPDPHTLFMQKINRLTLFRFDHEIAVSPG
jgi:hypothetical protein